MTSEQLAAYERGEPVQIAPGKWVAKYTPTSLAEMEAVFRKHGLLPPSEEQTSAVGEAIIDALGEGDA